MVKYLENEKDFAEITKTGKVLVDFYADWCGPCRMIAPFLDEIAKEQSDVVILKVDVDNFRDLAQLYSIYSIPTLKLFVDGKVVKTKTGFLTKKKLLDFIN
ncbi:MAG TPA: thioredoxin [Bacilli bacterium]|nr:thioredoxin [Bacilli bacterium]